jgi:hypothetical protein
MFEKVSTGSWYVTHTVGVEKIIGKGCLTFIDFFVSVVKYSCFHDNETERLALAKGSCLATWYID